MAKAVAPRGQICIESPNNVIIKNVTVTHIITNEFPLAVLMGNEESSSESSIPDLELSWDIFCTAHLRDLTLKSALESVTVLNGVKQ